MGFGFVDGVETVMVLDERVGVERLAAGRDRSAGLMSGILVVASGGGRNWRFWREAELERTAYRVRRQAGDVACRKDAYRDAVGSIIRACNESVELRDHDSRLRLIKEDGCGCENR